MLVITLLGSCNKYSQTAYPYADDLTSYLLQHHGVDIANMSNLYLLVIPVGGCTPCVRESLELAVSRKNNDNLIILLLADNPKQYIPYRKLIKELKPGNVFMDKEGKDNDYETGIFSPVLFRIINGEITYFKELDTQNIHVVAKEVFDH